MKQFEKAVENDKELAELEAEATAQLQEDSRSSGEDETPESESAPDEQTPQDEEPDETPSEDGHPAQADQEELSPEEVQRLSMKAQKRFQKVTGDVKRLSEEAEALRLQNEKLEKQIAQITQGSEVPDEDELPEDLDLEIDNPEKGNKSGKLPWEDDEEGDDTGEITEEQLEARIRKASREESVKLQKELQNKRLTTALATRFQNDIKLVQDQWPLFDPSKEDEYNDELVQELSDEFRLIFEKDPKARFYDFINKRMAKRQALIDEGRRLAEDDTTERIQKQAAEQPISSTTTVTRKGTLDDRISGAKNIDELEALESSIGTTK